MTRRSRLLQSLSAIGIVAAATLAAAQSACPSGYRVIAHHYDAELRKIWELQQNCLHPDWPAHSAVSSNTAPVSAKLTSLQLATVSIVQPVLVHAGEPVHLWSQDASSRIEITGIAEQSARLGDRINVRITHQTESGVNIQHIAGTVRATDDVEIAQ
jgi:hypothetical protein